MIYEMTVQVRVSDMIKGQQFYEALLNRAPDTTPHEGFAEWELTPNCWLHVAEGNRLGLFEYKDEEAAKEKLQQAVRR